VVVKRSQHQIAFGKLPVVCIGWLFLCSGRGLSLNVACWCLTTVWLIASRLSTSCMDWKQLQNCQQIALNSYSVPFMCKWLQCTEPNEAILHDIMALHQCCFTVCRVACGTICGAWPRRSEAPLTELHAAQRGCHSCRRKRLPNLPVRPVAAAMSPGPPRVAARAAATSI
jgi:hypothetical protein